MNYYIKNIHINHLFHLQDVNIPISSEIAPHLMLTGKNGSGKTVLLNAIASFLDIIKDDVRLNFTTYRQSLEYFESQLNNGLSDAQALRQAQMNAKYFREQTDALFGKVELDFIDVTSLIKDYQAGNFIIAFYQAARKSEMIEPKNPTKPEFATKGNVRNVVSNQFLHFLSDLKIQEALARNEQQLQDADLIAQWFTDFEEMLRSIYQDKQLQLKFNYKDYSFQIHTGNKAFKFTETSDGFAAILDIVADLILKMQASNNLVRAYQKKGIVLIDEVETHLHLELQRIIMPILTKIFPNIQFIVTTHSPFVLNSMNNAIAFDLEHQKILDDLTDYSYDALAEGYFGVSTGSSYMDMQLDKLHRLLEKESLSEADKQAIRLLTKDFEELPEVASPNIVGEFLQLKCQYADKLKNILAL